MSTVFRRAAFAYVLIIFIATFGNKAEASFILSQYGSGNPTDSWGFSTRFGVGQGNSTTWLPHKSDWVGETFEGYVVSQANGGWTTLGSGESYPDAVYVFRTFVMSDHSMTIPLVFVGDDGHSIYVDDALTADGPFGAQGFFNLTLTAGVPRKIELSVYNGVGLMGVRLAVVDQALPVSDWPKINGIEGVSINANGFASVPEPCSFGLALLALAGIAGTKNKRKD